MTQPRPLRAFEEEAEAQAYAAAIRDATDTTDWSAWNRRIVDRWSKTALERVKRRAWKILGR